ncbi:hypothetical protein CEV08_06670 [Bartonella tribocorum]|uniref:Uncharacterized protein n=1 Tax=Bartonella tribocorum TaxID=85701 RepID=A0A2M6USM4_9HYPH|nr:hypothetical protein CEV08_06670 [Bartonella tribocorum]
MMLFLHFETHAFLLFSWRGGALIEGGLLSEGELLLMQNRALQMEYIGAAYLRACFNIFSICIIAIS